MQAGEVYINPASGERAVVVLGTRETGRKRLVVDLYLRPDGGMVGRHYHPSIREQFTVIKGQVSFTLNGLNQSAASGRTVNIPPGTWHDFWNSGSSEALVRVDVQPADRFVMLIKNGFSLAQDGKTDHTGKPSLLQIALMARQFDDVIRYDKGPRVIQKILFLVLTPFAKLKGLKGTTRSILPGPQRNRFRWTALQNWLVANAPTEMRVPAPREDDLSSRESKFSPNTISDAPVTRAQSTCAMSLACRSHHNLDTIA